jgi:predicted dehydrogenase
MAAIIFDGKQTIVPVDGEEGVKDLKVIDAIYQAVRTGKRVDLKV